MAGNVDMFSLLDEALLITIVSFLPFEEAARTCVLSKRWSKIWQSTRNIEFDELFFVDYYESDETKEARRRVFFSFVTNFMKNYNSNTVDKFFLSVSNPESCADFIERCVAFATEHGVKELRLDFSDPIWEVEDDNNHHDSLFQLPNHVYGHASLEALELYSCGFAMPDLCNLVALKDVSFGWIPVTIDTLKTLLSTLGKLEILSLEKCWNLAHFDMGSKELGLRRLFIKKCHFVISDYVDFRAPNLKFLKYTGKLGIFQVKVLPNVLKEAQLDFTPMTNFEEYGDELCESLYDLRYVKILAVCSFLLQDYVNPYPFDFEMFCKEQYEIFECSTKTLKVVEMKGFRGRRNEMFACYYLIKVGCVLEQLIINVAKKYESDETVAKRYACARSLLNVSKVSENLQILIV